MNCFNFINMITEYNCMLFFFLINKFITKFIRCQLLFNGKKLYLYINLYLSFLISYLFQCYSYSVIDAYGVPSYQKGCMEKRDLQYFMCNTKEHSPDKPNTGQYSGSCCRGDLCNNGSFPVLTPRVFSCK